MRCFNKRHKYLIIFQVYPDPIFETFPEKEKKIKNYKYAPQSYLTINGRIQMPDINVLRKEDIRVNIGTGICNVTSGMLSQPIPQPITLLTI